MSPKQMNNNDLYIGHRLRARRMQIGMTQDKLAEHLQLTFQQVQKYEKGANRIGAGRLLKIASALNVPITYFFDGAPDHNPGIDQTVDHAAVMNADRHGNRIIAIFAQMNDGQRSALRSVAESMVAPTDR